MKDLYAEHFKARQSDLDAALEATGFDALVIGAGAPMRYFADDQDAVFRSTPHFNHWLPLEGPHHLLWLRSGKKPVLVRVAPEDYWYEQAPLGDPFWASHFDLREVPGPTEAWNEVDPEGRTAYIGNDGLRAVENGIEQACLNPEELTARLDWNRAYKSAYEVAHLEIAAELGARGHVAAKASFEAGGSELEIHRAFVQGTGSPESDLPYPTIVGLDEKGAILHYTGKRTGIEGRVLLIDAGARSGGYCSDITRTWTRAGCDPIFAEMVKGVDRFQLELCDMVRPGIPYPDIHIAAHVKVGELLHELGVLKLAGEDAMEAGVTTPFLPHGVGHFLGIQVHDIGGHQRDPKGGSQPPPDAHPYLRTTRQIEEHEVFTIEPGIYMIEMLLREHRSGKTAAHFDWSLIDQLIPFGGVRIEDDVLVTGNGHRNLSRVHV